MTSTPKPDIVQMFDKYIDREYYKVTSGFFGNYETLIRTDSFYNSTVLEIECKNLPHKVIINGEEYKLVKNNLITI